MGNFFNITPEIVEEEYQEPKPCICCGDRSKSVVLNFCSGCLSRENREITFDKRLLAVRNKYILIC